MCRLSHWNISNFTCVKCGKPISKQEIQNYGHNYIWNRFTQKRMYYHTKCFKDVFYP